MLCLSHFAEEAPPPLHFSLFAFFYSFLLFSVFCWEHSLKHAGFRIPEGVRKERKVTFSEKKEQFRAQKGGHLCYVWASSRFKHFCSFFSFFTFLLFSPVYPENPCFWAHFWAVFAVFLLKSALFCSPWEIFYVWRPRRGRQSDQRERKRWRGSSSRGPFRPDYFLKGSLKTPQYGANAPYTLRVYRGCTGVYRGCIQGVYGVYTGGCTWRGVQGVYRGCTGPVRASLVHGLKPFIVHGG